MPNRVIAIAKAECGYLEKQTNSQLDDKTANAGYNNFTKYARDLALWGVYNGSKQGFAWCDQFIDYCMIMAYGLDTALKMTGQAKGGYGAGCTESANYYKAIGRFYTSKPQVGDQIFFTSDGGKTMYHTGLVWKVAETMVYTIEGNTSSTLGVVDNGGGVFEKYYLLTSSKIGGYGRPDYSLVPADINYNSADINYNSADINYNETEDEELTQEQFNTFMNNYLAQNTGAACSDWAQVACQKAIDNGTVLGDGNGNFKWPLPLTREAFVVMANRMGLLE